MQIDYDFTISIFGFDDLEVSATVDYSIDEYSIPHDAGDHHGKDITIQKVTINTVHWQGCEMPDDFLHLKKRSIGFHPETATVRRIILNHVQENFPEYALEN